MTEEKIEAENYNVMFGSINAEHCDGVINILGKGLNQRPFRFREGEDGKIMLNCIVRDQDLNKVVVLFNSKVQCIQDGYYSEIKEDPIHIVIKNEDTGEIWLDFEEIGPKQFKLNGIFHIPNFKFKITNENLLINSYQVPKMTVRGFDEVLTINKDGSIKIGK